MLVDGKNAAQNLKFHKLTCSQIWLEQPNYEPG